ncbi:MAG: endolytic transglycosylase MltG [Actinomycetota bacterium]|nr:endolytic transglycosylase MltG [Actinomycetota bacterium]
MSEQLSETESRLPPGRRSRRWPRRLAVMVLTVLALLAAGLLAARELAGFLGEMVPSLPGLQPAGEARPVEPGLPAEVEISPGASARQIGEQLTTAGVIGSPLEFELAVRSSGVANQLQAGRYSLQTGMDVDAVLQALLAGPQVETYWVTVVEGLRIEEILASISDQAAYPEEELAQVLLGGRVSSRFLSGDAESLQAWEGLLFPDTYEFAARAGPAEILGRMAATMEERMEAAEEARLDQLGVTPYEALVVASLVESEARVDQDRGRIASVIYNRLRAGMPLQIDATVLYALGEHDSVVTLEDLEVDSPYNTYRHRGLPPTPIGAPGLASVQAALDPPATDYLYYVLTDVSGKHSFTASYDEFLRLKERAKQDGVIP